MKNCFILFACFLMLATSCKKSEGEGGSSFIKGKVYAEDFQLGRPEITEVIFSTGTTLEHGDYWILNNISGLTQYYIYYDNPLWGSEANPYLEGRTGIKVSFNYSDSNVDLAINTINAMSEIVDNDFTLVRNVDVVSFIGKAIGDAPDADNVTSPFEVNTASQGKYNEREELEAAVDEKVYIVYGDQTIYGDVERTGGDGEFQFTNLTEGNYLVYAMSIDSVTGSQIKVTSSVTISDKKSITETEDLLILK
jgi:hypothetical protein